MRGFYFPERSILEGKFGTKAEASTHADFAIIILETRHDRFTNFLNPQLIDQLMLWNYGRETVGSVFVKAAPIADNRRAFLREVFRDLLNKDPAVALKGISSTEVKERLGLPISGSTSDDYTSDFDERKEKSLQRMQAQGQPGGIFDKEAQEDDKSKRTPESSSVSGTDSDGDSEQSED